MLNKLMLKISKHHVVNFVLKRRATRLNMPKLKVSGWDRSPKSNSLLKSSLIYPVSQVRLHPIRYYIRSDPGQNHYFYCNCV